MTFPPAGAGLCPAHQSPDWFPQLGLLGAAMRRLCPMSRNRQSSELGKKATDPGHEDPGLLRRGTDWRDLNGVVAGPRQSPPRQNTSMGFARACPGKAVPGWKRRHFGRFPLAPVPVGIQGWGSTRRSSPTRDGQKKLCPGRTTSELQIQRQPRADKP